MVYLHYLRVVTISTIYAVVITYYVSRFVSYLLCHYTGALNFSLNAFISATLARIHFIYNICINTLKLQKNITVRAVSKINKFKHFKLFEWGECKNMTTNPQTNWTSRCWDQNTKIKRKIKYLNRDAPKSKRIYYAILPKHSSEMRFTCQRITKCL